MKSPLISIKDYKHVTVPREYTTRELWDIFGLGFIAGLVFMGAVVYLI